MVAALGSPNLMEATNAAGILCTILSLDCQSTRTAISSSPLIVTNIEKALSGTGDLPHNAALLVSMLSTITSFRRAFVKSDGLGLLVDLLTKSEDAGEQTNLLYALVTLAKGGRDCHTELYELLAESGMAWTLVRTLMQSPDAKVEENARALAGQLRTMPQSLALERTGSSDAVHALALLSCDNRNPSEETTPQNASTTHWSPSSKSPSRDKRKNRTVSPWDRTEKKRKLEQPRDVFGSQQQLRGEGLSTLASLLEAPDPTFESVTSPRTTLASLIFSPISPRSTLASLVLQPTAVSASGS
jgi:hypothetical protein